MRTNNINFQNISYINDTGIPDENNETIIPAFTAFEVFPRFSTVLSGTTSNVEVNFDAMFSGTNQWNINNSYAIDVYVTIYDKENSLNSKIYKTLKNVPTGININNTEYWQDETSAYFEIKQDGKAYHKYINKISKCYTHAIKIKSTFNPIQQNVIIDWGDGTFINLSNAVELADNEELSNVLGSEKDGSKDVIVKNPKQLTENQFGKNDSYSYYCYHDYMPAMVRDGIVQVTVNEDETITAKQGLPDKPYKILIYGTTYFGIGQDMGITLTRRIEPKDYITQERTIVPSFSHVLISRIFDDDLPFYPTTATTLASFANGAKNLLYINIPKYFNGFDTCINTYEMFERCSNLQYCNGFNNKLRFNSLRGMCRMFNGCKNLIKCDIKLAKNVVDHNIDSVHDGNKGIFTDCNNLAVDLLSLLPLDGFSSRYMNLIETFKNCKSLDTTNEHANYIKELLWKDTFKIWKTYNGSDNIDKTTATFYGCNQLNKKMNFIPDGWKNNKKYIDPDLIVVDIPKLNDLTYTGDEQTIGITSNDEYIVDDNSELTKTNVGTYKVILRIKNGYIWSDKTFENKEIEWSITQATNTWTIEPELSETKWTEGDTSVTLTNGVAKFGEVVMKLNNEDFTNLPTEQGEYTLTFNVDGTNNYSGLNKTISFEILKPEVIEPEEIDLNFNLDYGEAIAGLGENNDEVAVIFKNSDLANMEWTAPCDLENVQFLVVGGGGGGGGAVNSTKGGAGGAGGGGGCVVTGIVNKINKNDIVSIQIGKGGNGGTYYNGTTTGKGNASHGGNSIFKVNDITYITAFGGAGDLGYNKNSGVNNGSNSGSRYNGTTASAAVGTATTWDQTALSDKLSNVIIYRNKGGYNPENKGSASGGGGGACGVGYNVPSSAYGGYGGVGLLTNITGDDIMFGAGGAGGTRRDSGFISLGGGDNEDTGFRGGAGSGTYNGNGTSGLPNQGGGGGGAGTKGNGGNGGSGIVILRFKATNINIDPSYIKIKLTAPNNNYNINTVSDKINNVINENEDNSTFLSASTYYSYDTEYRIAAAEDASKNSIPIEFKWKNSIGDTTLKLWRTKDIESNPDTIPLFQTTSSNNYAIYYDPEVGRNYTYELSDSTGNVTRDTFYTSQRVPRVIYENQDPTTSGAEASNMRDIGGWLTIDGTKMVKQSMIYRSAMLEWCSPLADQNIISPNIHLQDNLGIRVELELRDYNHVKKYFIDDGWKCSWKPDEAMSITDSTIGPKVERYCPNANGYAAFPSYGDMFSTDSKKAVYAAFNKIYESIIDNKPVLFHCSQGKDRTGCLTYILLGMLGVSELNAKRDYGFTYYSQNKDDILMTSTDGYSSLKTNVLDRLPTGSTFQDRCKAYIKQCGEAADDSNIDTKIINFIEFMLEDVDNSDYSHV